MHNIEVGLFHDSKNGLGFKPADSILRNEKLRNTLEIAYLPKCYSESDGKKYEGFCSVNISGRFP